MTHVVVLGAGLGGTIMAYEMRDHLKGKSDKVTVINKGENYSFVPSAPWVAVGWRTAQELTVDLRPVMARRGIEFKPQGAKRIHPECNEIELMDGTSVSYDYLVIATGPELAYDEVEGLGPDAYTHSICHVNHAANTQQGWKASLPGAGRSLWARHRVPPASAQRTSSASFSIRPCARPLRATECR